MTKVYAGIAGVYFKVETPPGQSVLSPGAYRARVIVDDPELKPRLSVAERYIAWKKAQGARRRTR